MSRPPRRAGGKGVALGVLGLMILAFFAIVFMATRPGSWKSFEEMVQHPFDPHPIGIDTRHKDEAKAAEAAALQVQKLEAENAELMKKLEEQKKLLEGVAAGAEGKAKQTTAAEKPAAVLNAEPEGDDGDDDTDEVDGDASDTNNKPEQQQKQEVVKRQGEVEKDEEDDVTVEEKREIESGNDKVETTDDAKDEGTLTALDKEYRPTREMVQKIAQEGYLMVTWANYHYIDFVRTWVKHVQAVGVTGYIVGAMDDQLLKELIELKYNCFSMKSGLTLGDFGWGSPTFAKMGREKIRLISIFLNLGVQVVIADVDVLWLRNPLPFFNRYPEADILTSSDHMSATVKEEGLEKWPDAGAAANIGIMLFRNRSLPFVEKWIEIIEADDKVWDQNAFNDLFRQGVRMLNPPNKNLFLGYDGTLTMGILPVSQFCSGHTFFVQRLGERLGLEPYAVHATFQFSGTNGKRNRMREFMLYDDPPEYFDHKVGFISYDLDGIEDLLPTAGPNTNDMTLNNVQGHFKLVNHQITRMRHAFAISSVITGRALVMPPMYCGLDRWWAPHSGRIPGSDFKLPFQCPLDHVLDLENGVMKLPAGDHFGPATEIREYSFFNNKRMTAAVRDDRVVVELCAAGDALCSDGKTPAPIVTEGSVRKVRVQAGLLSNDLSNALLNAKHAKVLHFTTMKDALKGFSDKLDAQRFNERMKLYGSIWCCVHAHPGHIHYDMQWDVVPHTDKFTRTWNATWVPTTGP